MKAKTTHPRDDRASQPVTSFEIETAEDYALAVDRLKALESGQKEEEAAAEAGALRAAIKAWEGRGTESPSRRGGKDA